MSALNRIITRNALRAIERAEKNGDKRFTPRAIGYGMALYFEPPNPPKAESVYRQLLLLLDPSSAVTWDVAYLDAFCRYVGVPPDQLTAENYDGATRPAPGKPE